jgi:hypothetical protein
MSLGSSSSEDLTIKSYRQTIEAIQKMVSSGENYSDYILSSNERSFSLSLSCDLITHLEFDKAILVKLYLLPTLQVVFKGKCSALFFDGLFCLPVCSFEDSALCIDLPRKTKTKIFCGLLSPELRAILLELNPEFLVRAKY